MICRKLNYCVLPTAAVTGSARFLERSSFEDTGMAIIFFGLHIAVYLIIWMADSLGDIIDERILNLKLEECRQR